MVGADRWSKAEDVSERLMMISNGWLGRSLFKGEVANSKSTSMDIGGAMEQRMRLSHLVKWSFDFTLALILIVLLMPLLFMIACSVVSDGGSILFVHSRVGRSGQRFGCFKFRTMVVDADEVLAATLASDPEALAEWTTRRKLVKDPRVTQIGHFLRRSSLDELPQLINVLRGDMSIVGPRPIVSEEVSKYGEDIQYYYKVRPGITGLWQVNGRSRTTFAERVLIDKRYVRDWNLYHDLDPVLKVMKRAAVCGLGERRDGA